MERKRGKLKLSTFVKIRFFAKTSDIRIFFQNIRSDVEVSEVATLVIDNFQYRLCCVMLKFG